MPIAYEEYGDLAAINSELRLITLELMKIAAQEHKPFEHVLREFTENAFRTKKTLMKADNTPRRRH